MGSSGRVADYGHEGWKVIIVAAILILMQFLMVSGRFASRKMQKVSLATDDFVLLIAAFFTTGFCGLALAFPRIAAVSSHIARIQEMSPSEGTVIGQSYIAWMIVYVLSIALSKCSILLLYVRVFTTSKRAFTFTAYLVGFIIIATAIANTFVAVLQCKPQAFAWNKSIKGGTCIDLIAWARYIAIPNVVTGAVMLVMPLPIVWRLNVSFAAKVALTATFLHGIIGFVASCARLIILFSTEATHLSNDSSLAWTIWTINEPANYIIAACLPTLRPIFVRILPASFFILTKKRTSKPYTSSIKASWPKGSLGPKLHLESRRFMTSSQIAGPWNGTATQVRKWEADGQGGWTGSEAKGVEGSSEGKRGLVARTDEVVV